MEDIKFKGTRVKVVRGRKVPVGTAGNVVWIGYYQRGYIGSGIDPFKREQKIGIKDDDGNMWYTYTKNCEIDEKNAIEVKVEVYTEHPNGDIELKRENKFLFGSYIEAVHFANDKSKHNTGGKGKIDVFVNSSLFESYYL